MKNNPEFDKFSDLTKRLIGVSKEEFNRREAEWKKERERQRKSKKQISRGVSRDSGEDNA